jgi:hypothetical protein
MDHSNCTEHPKKEKNIARRKEVEGEDAGSGNSSTDSLRC